MYKLAVIIPAAGSGSRMGSRIPKPFIQLNGQPILAHTIRNFLHVNEVIQIIVPTGNDSVKAVEEIVGATNNSRVHFHIVEGGAERQHSIQNALAKVFDEVDLVAVHDAVRPFIKPALIKKCADEAQKYKGAIIAVPAKDTIKIVDKHGAIERTPNRETLWQAQTPQIFSTKLLKKAYQKAIENNFVGTDDASLVERLGVRVKVVEGNRENLKITYPIDLQIAELFLKNEALL